VTGFPSHPIPHSSAFASQKLVLGAPLMIISSASRPPHQLLQQPLCDAVVATVLAVERDGMVPVFSDHTLNDNETINLLQILIKRA